MTADTLAQFIRQIDAGNRLGAGALAEKIVEWMATQAPAPEHGPSLPSGWRVQRNEDGSIGLFAPPPVDGESRRTSELFTGKLGSDMNEIVFKLLTHMLDATQAPAVVDGPACTRSHPHEDMSPACEALTTKARAANLVRRFELVADEFGGMFRGYEGRAMPDDVYARFCRLRDERIPALRAELVEAIVKTTPGHIAEFIGEGKRSLTDSAATPG